MPSPHGPLSTNDPATTDDTARERQRAAAAQPPVTSVDLSPAFAGVHVLQRQAGNRAVTSLLNATAAPTVQRGPRPGADDSQFHLHLDPQIEAQIRAIAAMRAMMAPETVTAGLLDLRLPTPTPMPPTPMPAAPSRTPPQPSAASAVGPAPGTGLTGPRAGTAGDIWKAVLAEPALGPAITALGDEAAGRARAEWDSLSTGQAAAVVTGSVVVGGATVAGILAIPSARQWISTMLADKIIPVPTVPGLGVQLNLSGPTVLVGLHLDVSRILPKALGFGPASQTTPLGSPMPDQVQRRHLAERPAPVQRHLAAPAAVPHAPVTAPSFGRTAGPVVQRAEIAGGVGGATAAATGGAIDLRSVQGSFVVPGGKLLSGTATREIRTTGPTTVSATITRDRITLSFAPAIYIDAQWPVQNMRVNGITHTFADNLTSPDVSAVDDEWGDGIVDVTATARQEIANTIGQIIRHSVVDRAAALPDPRREPVGGDAPTGQGPPPGVGRTPPVTTVAPPPYDPLADASPGETLRALRANFESLPTDGRHDDIEAAELSRLTVGATVVVTRPVVQVDGGAGLRIAAGTAVTIAVDGGGTVPTIQDAVGQGTAAVLAAADVQAVRASSSGIEVVKDGTAIATVDEVTVRRGGTVKIDRITLLGEAAEAARTERGVWDLIGVVVGAARMQQNPLSARSAPPLSDTPVVVPGIVSGLLESKLQTALTDLLATHGRTLVPGVDLGSVLGVPGGPARVP